MPAIAERVPSDVRSILTTE
uniref:Uncharacterized protein n=1 Tax=Arundo donax TaxID=35708 RepID=A0A0A8YZB4_ARUDO